MTLMNQVLTLGFCSNDHPSGYLWHDCWSPPLNKYQPLAKNYPLFFREEIVFIDHNESNGTINALRLGNSFIAIISWPRSWFWELPRSPLCTLYNCQGAYKAHWVTEGNIMSYSKDIACIDVQRRSLLLFSFSFFRSKSKDIACTDIQWRFSLVLDG